MKRAILATLLFLFSVVAAKAQVQLTASDSGACTTAGACLSIPVGAPNNTASLSLSGTFSATAQFEVSGNGGISWSSVNAIPTGGGSAVTSATATGTWQATVSGLTNVRIRLSVFSSGPVGATINLSTATAGGGGGGGAPTGAAGGELAGTYPNPTLARLITINSAAPFNFTGAGSFGNSTTDNFSVGIGSTCPEQTIIGGGHATNGVTSCIVTPSSAVTNGFSSALTGLIQVNDPNSGGQFGKVEGVGEYSVCQANANNTKCEAGADQASSVSGHTGNILLGREISVSPQNTSDTGYGVLADMLGSNIQPGSNMIAFDIQQPTGSATWNLGYVCENQSITTGTGVCFQLGTVFAASGGSNSQKILFNASESGGTIVGLKLFTYIDANNKPYLETDQPNAAFPMWHPAQPSAGTYATALAISSSTTGTFTFAGAFNSAPVCTVSPRTALGTTTYSYTVSASAVVVTLSVSGSDTFDIICVGNPN